jgi:hypothetical protein
MTQDNSPFRPTERVLREFSGTWVAFFGTLAVWQQFHHHRPGVAIALAAAALTMGPVGLAWPRAMRPVFIGWMALVYPIGWTMSRIVLGAVFYGLFTPVAYIFRIVGRDELRLRPQPQRATYWQIKPRVNDNAQYLRQF